MFKIIVAHDPNRVIGNGLLIPWHIKEDFKHFKETTTGHVIIYGSNTFKSIGHALPNRTNIVINYDKNYPAEGCEICTDINELIKKYKDSQEIAFVCGGASIYQQLLPYTEELIISEVRKEYEGNIFFPPYKDQFELYKEDPREEFIIKYYKRKHN